MEGLEGLGIDWKLLVAQIINFLVLLLILNKFLFGPVVKLLSERRQKVIKGIKDAEDAREKLSSAEEQEKAIVSKASREAEKILLESKKQADHQTSEILARAKEKSNEIIGQAKQQARLESEKEARKAKAKIAELITVAVEKILGEKTDRENIEKTAGGIR